MADRSLFSEHVCSSSFQEEFKKHWNAQDDFKGPKFEIISNPFKICKIPNFLKDDKLLENLKSELMKRDFTGLYTDLYEFERTDDFINMSGDDYVSTLYKSFQSTLAPWMERNTDIKLSGKISMSSARYYDTHHLLCHDDNMGDRRIAYILYLSKDWTEQDGGTLDLFDMDQRGAPGKIVRSLVPEYNSLVFFEVVHNSYHQVGEVTTSTKCRWSINGWFHGPIGNDCHKQPRYEIAQNLLRPSMIEMNLNSWITEQYLLQKITKQIQRSVEKISYAFLENFLNKSTYRQLANDLTSEDISWHMTGPADMRHYEVADEKTLPQSLRQFCCLFKSISFFRLLKMYTGLDLMPEDTVRSPKMKLELQRWSAGCYTLLYDKRMLEDATDEVDISDNSSADSEFLDTTQYDIAASSIVNPSTANDKAMRDGTDQQLKRKRTSWFSSGENTYNKKKMAKDLDNRRSVVDQKSPTKEETGSMNKTWSSTKNDRLETESDSATGSSPHKSVAINCDAKVDITTESEEDEEDTSVVCNDDDSSNDDDEDSISTREGYALDVILQFHTTDAEGAPKMNNTIDYVNPCEKNGIIVEVPQKDNHLCLAYKSPTVCRLQHYLNHFYDGYTYTLLCMYYE